MGEEKNVLEYVSQVKELQSIADYLDDPVVNEALGYVVKLSVKSTADPSFAGALIPLVNRIQALSAQCSLKAKYYTVLEKGPESSARKNLYYTLADVLDNIVNALKYSVKNGY